MAFISPLENRESRDKEHKRIYRAIGAFLAEHGLYPTPANYALGFELAANAKSVVAQAVRDAISDGLRLRQSDADRIVAKSGLLRAAPGGSDEAQAALAAAGRQIDEFATLVELTRTETSNYGADLEASAAELSGMGELVPVSSLLSITGAILERTKAAEAQLDAARDETQSLRARLAAVEREARSDPLTGLPNRRALRDRWTQLEKSGALISVGICDIDRFKSINDVHGHEVGDRVLRMVAGRLEESCAPHLVVRLGGEEFVILFEGINSGAAAAILDEAREALALRHFRDQDSGQQIGTITFSAGVACGCGCKPSDPLLQRADALLYEAKNAGRNRIRFEAH